MFDDFQWDDEEELSKLASRFDTMLQSGSLDFFDAEEYEDLIDYYYMNGDDEKARLALDYARKYFPDNSNIKIRIARQLAISGEFTSAIKLLDNIENEGDELISIIMTRASIFSMMMEFEKAANEFEKALLIADEEEMEDILASIATEYENMGAFDTAITYFKKALDISADPEQILFEIAICYEMGDRVEDAIDFFKLYIDKNPYSLAAWFNYGLGFYHLGLYEKAIDAFEYALAIDDSYIAAYISMAQSYSGLGEHLKALEIYNETHTIEEPDARTLYQMGVCYENLLEYELAFKYFEKAIVADEEYAEPWAGRARLLEIERRYKNALRSIQKASEIDPFNTDFVLLEAKIHRRLEYYNHAKECYQVHELLDPYHVNLWKEFSAMYLETGELMKAEQVLKTGLIHLPDHSKLMYYLSAVLVIKNNMQQALYYLEKALKIDYEEHETLSEFLPDMMGYPEIVKMILDNKPNPEF